MGDLSEPGSAVVLATAPVLIADVAGAVVLAVAFSGREGNSFSALMAGAV